MDHIITHLGEESARALNAVSPPIFQTSNFCFETVEEMRAAISNESQQPFYSRGANPTVAVLRKKLAALESAEECLLFASGAAATTAAVMAQVGQGDHILSVKNPYSWTGKLITKLLARFGVEHTMVDGTEVANFENAIRPNTKVIMLESPNSITYELQDIEAVCKIAKEKSIVTVVDNSYSSPLYQQPIIMGADIVVHSGTKYINGHSDTLAGVLCCSKQMYQKIFGSEFMTLGAVLSPMDAWLVLRGLRTLPIRMKRVAETTPMIVEFLENHPRIEKMYYPFSPSFPQLDLAKKQMSAPSGLFSILLKADSPQEVDAFCDKLNFFLKACSWGGYESLVFPISALVDSENYKSSPLPWNLIRFYVGLEEPKTLIEDLKQAL